MGFAFHGLNRLETGVDGMMELRDPLMWIGVEVGPCGFTAQPDETIRK